jgi:hypothetical protein
MKGNNHQPRNFSDVSGPHHPNSDINLASGVEDTEDTEHGIELTHEEIWDDSALIDAWDAANEEYEVRLIGLAFFLSSLGFLKGIPRCRKGLEKRTHDQITSVCLYVSLTGLFLYMFLRSWYNVPAAESVRKKPKGADNITSTSQATIAHENDDEDNSKPIDFDTFVPAHDASLHIPAGPSAPDFSAYLETDGGADVGVDSAFERALGAMYWAGYWTAVYHVRLIFFVVLPLCL